MLKKWVYILFSIILLTSLSSCSTSSRAYTDPWPGLYQLKETNKRGFHEKKERKKELRKIRKQRAKNRK